MKKVKYYVISDVHSYYTPMKKALKNAGFFEEKKPHKLVVCGDLLDRGKEVNQTIDFMLQQMEEGKLIYIKGNHEDLLTECMGRIENGKVHEVACGMTKDLLSLTGIEHICLRTINS